MSDILTILFVLVGFACIATAPFNLFPYHVEIVAIGGSIGFVTTIVTLASELRGYRIVLKRD